MKYRFFDIVVENEGSEQLIEQEFVLEVEIGRAHV